MLESSVNSFVMIFMISFSILYTLCLKIWTGKLVIMRSNGNQFANFVTVINKMKCVKDLVWQLSPYFKSVAAISRENKTSEIDANCTMANTTKLSSYRT